MINECKLSCSIKRAFLNPSDHLIERIIFTNCFNISKFYFLRIKLCKVLSENTEFFNIYT
jgi:hypothetical protein